jgi:hypothetical protein
MVGGHDHDHSIPRFSYERQGAFRGPSPYSYSPSHWRGANGPYRRGMTARMSQEDAAMKTALYVGAGALGVVGVGALIWLIAKK